MISYARLAIVAFTALGCASSLPTGSTPDANVPMVRLRAEPFSFSYYSGMDQSARLVIRDAATWLTVWNKIHGRQSPTPPLPAIDFSQEMIVVAALGSRSTGGYGILLDGASGTGSDATSIMVRSVSPGPRCVVTQALTQPVDIARLPRRDGALGFVEQSEVVDCK